LAEVNIGLSPKSVLAYAVLMQCMCAFTLAFQQTLSHELKLVVPYEMILYFHFRSSKHLLNNVYSLMNLIQ